MPKLTDESIFPSDVSKYEGAMDCRIANQLCEATLVLRGADEAAFPIEWLFEEDCVTNEEIEVGGNTAYKITYRKGKEKTIIDYIIDSSPEILVLKGSGLYDKLKMMHLQLATVFFQEEYGFLPKKK